MTAGTRGRPRDTSIDAKALAAARAVVGMVGLAGRASMSAIAEAAGTGKPTLYLRWDSLDDLVTAALDDLERTERRRVLARAIIAAAEELDEDTGGRFLVALVAAGPPWRDDVAAWARGEGV